MKCQTLKNKACKPQIPDHNEVGFSRSLRSSQEDLHVEADFHVVTPLVDQVIHVEEDAAWTVSLSGFLIGGLEPIHSIRKLEAVFMWQDTKPSVVCGQSSRYINSYPYMATGPTTII